VCERNEKPDVYAVLVDCWFNLERDDAALREGWYLTPCEGSEHGPLRVQRADTRPRFKPPGACLSQCRHWRRTARRGRWCETARSLTTTQRANC
jgi:hypothetical protein